MNTGGEMKVGTEKPQYRLTNALPSTALHTFHFNSQVLWQNWVQIYQQ